MKEVAFHPQDFHVRHPTPWLDAARQIFSLTAARFRRSRAPVFIRHRPGAAGKVSDARPRMREQAIRIGVILAGERLSPPPSHREESPRRCSTIRRVRTYTNR